MSDDFLRLYEENVSDVYGYFVYRLGSRSDAEASTQATFERAFREPEPFGNDSEQDRVRLLSIARTTAAGRGGEMDGEDPAISPDLARALGRLERVERAVLALRYGARMTLPEMAQVLELSDARARRALSRGLRRLRTELEREPVPHPFDQAESRSAPARLADHDQGHGEQQQRQT